MSSPSRNQPCPCGSGKKFKHCCAGKTGLQNTEPFSKKAQFNTLIELGLRAHQAGNLIAALSSYDKALLRSPDDPGLLGLKGMLLSQQGDLVQARVLLERALKLNPKDPRLHNYYAQILDAAGEPDQAQLEFIEAVRIEPRYLEAWQNVGKSLLLQHKTAEAILSLKEALSLAPKEPDIFYDLAEAHFLEGQYADALAFVERACEISGPSSRCLIWNSAIKCASGLTEQANTMEAQALNASDKDDLFSTLVKLGKLELHIGNLTSAEHYLGIAQQLRPDAPEPYVEMAAARKFIEADQPMVSIMENIRPSSNTMSRKLGFALGKIYTDLGDYDKSFHHYKVANALARRTTPYNPEKYAKWVDEQISLFQTERLNNLPHGSKENTPILIVGTPRSGTTLTESIISSHSRISAGGEMDYWSRVMPHIRIGFPKSFTPALASRLAKEYLGFLRRHSQHALCVTDKMPSNYQYLGIINTVFPNAKIIHTQRHPIDACLSIYFQNFTTSHAYKWDLDNLARWYEQYQRLMAHWRETLPEGSLFEFRYEDLVDDVEGVSRRMMAFLGLEWEPGQLDFHKQDRAVFTASKWQARQPIYKTSKDRWRRYEKHLGPLLQLLKYA